MRAKTNVIREPCSLTGTAEPTVRVTNILYCVMAVNEVARVLLGYLEISKLRQSTAGEDVLCLAALKRNCGFRKVDTR